MGSARILGGAFLACLLSVTAVTAEPAPSTLRDAFFNRPGERPLPPVARFEDEEGDEFVLDRTDGQSVFLQFEDNEEIWALTPSFAPRGDVIYKDDTGKAVLRTTRLGGLTLFTTDRPEGMAAAFDSPTKGRLRLPPVYNVQNLLRDFAQASARASRAVQKLVAFEAEEAPLHAAPLLADAAFVVSEAFVQVAGESDRGRKLAARFSKVEFETGKNPSADAKGPVVRITITPERGLAGRPSSRRVAAAISKR